MTTMPIQNPTLEHDRVFLVASPDPGFIDRVSEAITARFASSTVFSAVDGADAFFKLKNAPPHVVILDAGLTKRDAFDIAEHLLASRETEQSTSIILVTPLPDREQFVNQVVTAQVQFLLDRDDADDLLALVSRGLNRVALHDRATYQMRFLAPGEDLFREGEHAESVFFVRAGELEAYRGAVRGEGFLGTIRAGEFVGEMAHFNHEPRSASVVATAASELIEIPFGILDMVLFSKPAWSKALIECLARRLRTQNHRHVPTSAG